MVFVFVTVLMIFFPVDVPVIVEVDPVAVVDTPNVMPPEREVEVSEDETEDETEVEVEVGIDDKELGTIVELLVETVVDVEDVEEQELT